MIASALWIDRIARPHSDAAGNPLLAARHRSFIVTHAVAGAAGIVAAALYGFLASTPDPVVLTAFVGLIAPLVFAALLSRTGWLEAAHTLSALDLTVLVAFAAWHTGGVGSFLMVWLIVVPVEAALSASRRVIGAAVAMPLAALGALVLLESWSVLPADRSTGWPAAFTVLLGPAGAMTYAGLVGLAVQHLARRSEDAVRDRERRYRLMAENASDVISLHDPSGGTRFVSAGAGRILGVDAERLLSDGMASALGGGDRTRFMQALARVAATGEERSADLRLARSLAGTDQPTWVETRLRSLRGDDVAEPGFVVAVTRDVTARKQREAELERARDEAQSASRSKTRFLATMSHELRTPLNAIIGFSEILKTSDSAGRPCGKGSEYAALIHDSGTHLLQVVNDLLDISRIEAGHYELRCEPVDMGSIVRACADVMRPAMDARSVTLRIDSGLPDLTVEADPRALRQIVLNLLSNAVKFSGDGGEVSISTSVGEGIASLAIEDQGVGIDPADLPRLGEPFFQADGDYDRSFSGTGLGLSIVKGLVSLHRGTLVIESRKGHGTRVSVRLPHTEDAERGARDATESPKSLETALRRTA